MKQSKNILLPVWLWARVAPARWAETQVEQDWSFPPSLSSRQTDEVIDPKGPLLQRASVEKAGTVEVCGGLTDHDRLVSSSSHLQERHEWVKARDVHGISSVDGAVD